MLERSAKPKTLVIIIALAVMVLFVCVAVFIGSRWAYTRFQETPEPTAKPVSINYCGENLADLCVLSFSRDVFGNTIINLYVPIKKYPIFYLNVIRQSGASRFECEWEKKVRTSVHCTGKVIKLGEGFEMQLLSVKEDEIIAQGDFTLTAYLVTTQTADGEPSASDTPAPDTTEGASPTPTETPEELTETPTTIEEATELPEVTETATP